MRASLLCQVFCLLSVSTLLAGSASRPAVLEPAREFPQMVGLYVHQHWPYNHPYCARTWTLEDWKGFLQGLRSLGYNTVLVWPMLETMPDPLTASDRENLEKISRVIDLGQRELGMRVYIALCPNVSAKDELAGKYTFEQRPFFYVDDRVDPGDPEALSRMLRWREELLGSLAHANGFMIIDSDPGGYPGSNNVEFVYLLGAHRRLFDRLRPGIELYYWMHAGWPAYSRFYETAHFERGSEEEFKEALLMLRDLDPEPWGLANGLSYASQMGMENRVINFNYGAIESEPSFPMTNFGGERAYQAGTAAAPRGVMGNAQTHCLQLPNIFAFARGAQGEPPDETDYEEFAGDLVIGAGPIIVRSWKALAGTDREEMLAAVSELEELRGGGVLSGPLEGLLFGSPDRFLGDLVLQLRLRAALESFRDSVFAHPRLESNVVESFGAFVEACEQWQSRHGYKNYWRWDRMAEALAELHSPAIEELLGESRHRGPGTTGFQQVQSGYHRRETYTPRLLAAMKHALFAMEK